MNTTTRRLTSPQAFVKLTRHVPKHLSPFMHQVKTIRIRTVKVPVSRAKPEQIQKSNSAMLKIL